MNNTNQTENSNAAHTPGPWRVNSTELTVSIMSIDGLHVCEVDGYGCKTTQNAANACLIAAAPELLQALQACYETLNTYRLSVEGAGLSRAASDMFFDAENARAAIARATIAS